MKEPGEEHPHKYAANATPNDPAWRLGFLVKWYIMAGEPKQEYFHVATDSTLFKANSIVDRLLEAIPEEELAERPQVSKDTAAGAIPRSSEPEEARPVSVDRTVSGIKSIFNAVVCVFISTFLGQGNC
jgi:hypothetical protein